jgi:glyoxylase-like metal-dependent hydrolase (beta-lactamase superfamily II)
MALDAERLPTWVTWQRRPFPDANLLLLGGRQPALVDSGFVGHAQQTAAWTGAQAGQIALVVNTHWHADHVGGNGLLQTRALGSRPAPRTPRPSPAATPAAAKPNTSTSQSAPTPSMRRSTTDRSFGWATPTGRSSARPGTPPATCRCGSPRSGCW